MAIDLKITIIDHDYRIHDLLRIMVSLLLFGPKSVFDRNQDISDSYFETFVDSNRKSKTTSDFLVVMCLCCHQKVVTKCSSNIGKVPVVNLLSHCTYKIMKAK